MGTRTRSVIAIRPPELPRHRSLMYHYSMHPALSTSRRISISGAQNGGPLAALLRLGG